MGAKGTKEEGNQCRGKRVQRRRKWRNCTSKPETTSSIMRKNGTKVQKRTLQLNDMAGRSVELTLWGWLQTICHAGEFPVLATKVVRSNDFNGKSVGTIATSQLYVEADFTINADT
ncbi:hypothetical protein JHK82_055743 [Glycine max]|nr:hypothetical protein JHK82_055743 [Glycine max]